jgi:hypothetical protein
LERARIFFGCKIFLEGHEIQVVVALREMQSLDKRKLHHMFDAGHAKLVVRDPTKTVMWLK